MYGLADGGLRVDLLGQLYVVTYGHTLCRREVSLPSETHRHAECVHSARVSGVSSHLLHCFEVNSGEDVS